MAGQSQPSGRPASGVKRTSAQKIAVVAETAILNEAELAEYCRAHGVYPEEVKAWRLETTPSSNFDHLRDTTFIIVCRTQ